MKDLKSTLGGGTVPVTLGSDGVLKGIIVSNKGDVGRRVGIFTNTPEITVGSKLHSADYRMTSKATTVPDGYLSGREVELAAKKEYSVVFDVEATAPFNAMHKQKSAPFTYIGSASVSGLDQAMEYVPYVLKTHTLATPCDIIDNHWFSMTLNLDGTDHHIAINAMKHPAAMTADLNAALAKIHPELRGIISVSPSSVIDDTRVRGQRIVDGQATPVVESISTTPKVNGVWVSADGLTIRGEGFIPQTEVEYHLDNTAPGEADSKAIVKADGSFIIKLKHGKESYYWELMFHVPNTISVSFPRTNYTTRETEGFVSNDKGLGLGQFHITHLNNLLGERHRFHYGEELFEAQALPTDPRLAEAYGVMEFLDNNLVTLLNFGDLNEAGQATVTIPAGHFKFLKDDTRYKAALLMINPSYKGGDFHRLNSIKIAGDDAELFIVKRTKDGKSVGSSLIDLIKSEETQKWVGIDTGFAPHTTDNALYIPEYAAFNSRDYDPEVSDWFVREMAVLIIAPSDGFNGPLFTDTVEDVQVQLEYVKMTHIPNLLYEFNLDVGLETPGDYAKASLEFDPSSMEFDQPIRVEIIYDGVTHEESNFTVDKDDPMGPTLNILTNFQKKRFYESGASNNVTVRVLDEISAEDQVVRTRQMFIRNFNVDVTLPVFSSEIKIEDQTLTYKTTGHPDKYAFTGTYEKTAAAHPDTKQPFYWSKDIVLSASINGEVIESIGCYFTNVEAMGSDVIGELTVEVPPSYIMDSGPGQVTIEVKAVSTTKWDANETVIGQFRVTTQEDDVTFITAKDTVIVANPGFEFYGLGEAQIRVNGGDMMDWEGDSIVESLRDKYNLHVEQIETQSDPYDPYSIVRAIMFKHLGTDSIHVEVLLQNTPTVTPTPDNDGVNFDYEDAVFSMDLGEYVPMYTGKALLHPDVRLWNNGTTVAANDPNLKLKYVIEDMYLGTLLPEGTLFTNSNGDVIPYASEEYVPVVTNMGKGEYGFFSASVYVGDDYIYTTIYSHDESTWPSRIVSSAVIGDTTNFTLNGQTYALDNAANGLAVLDKTDVVIQEGDFTVDLQLPLELAGYKLQGPWPFAHEQTATVDESGHVSLTVTNGGMYGTREPFVFYVKLFNEFGAGDFVAMSISYGNPNTGD